MKPKHSFLKRYLKMTSERSKRRDFLSLIFITKSMFNKWTKLKVQHYEKIQTVFSQGKR